ncbi:DUF948 domain-containing protein [Floricoccus penangensis]|uniref:DUF948 domain-containing protein n=1 Tax=Floricoccus penangensis TaxID=1859475 RepID=UPI001E484215|nr:DUF948 domain-containing protein [Floricoccus penangensis]
MEQIGLGQIALLIIAIAFVVLVVFLVQFINKLSKTVDEVTKSVNLLTTDANLLSSQADQILAKTSVLLDDVNEKMVTIDPVFHTAADLSNSVSNVNESGQNFVSRFKTESSNIGKASSIITVGRATSKLLKNNKRKNNKNKKEQ